LCPAHQHSQQWQHPTTTTSKYATDLQRMFRVEGFFKRRKNDENLFVCERVERDKGREEGEKERA